MAAVKGEGHALHCVKAREYRWLRERRSLNGCSYVENIFEHNKRFDVEGLLAQDPSYASRLKYWTDELCHTKPNTFDFVITVCTPNLSAICTSHPLNPLPAARWRWHCPLRLLAIPTRRSTRPLLCPWLSRVPYEIRLRCLSADHI